MDIHGADGLVEISTAGVSTSSINAIVLNIWRGAMERVWISGVAFDELL